MREVILLRHGLTAWNEEGRIQGQFDVPLSAVGVDQVRSWRLPARYREAVWYVSPLQRAVDTARLLGIEPGSTAEALMEMDWGEWTGRRIAELRSAHGEAMADNERRGLDFQPPGGETPRMVRARLKAWLGTVDAGEAAIGMITHKGVIRAAISLATGWDLKADYVEKLRRDALHRFRLEDGRLRLEQLNVPI